MHSFQIFKFTNRKRKKIARQILNKIYLKIHHLAAVFVFGLRCVNVETRGGGGRRQGPKRQLTSTRVDVTEVYYKVHNFERFALRLNCD